MSMTRLYKPDCEPSDWQRTRSLGRDDLPRVMKVADQAWTWSHEHQQRSS